jgi:hypothetical protein
MSANSAGGRSVTFLSSRPISTVAAAQNASEPHMMPSHCGAVSIELVVLANRHRHEDGALLADAQSR